MDGSAANDGALIRHRTSRIVVRGEFGSLLAAAVPECEIATSAGTTRLTAHVRDEAELFGLVDRLRDFGAEIVSVAIDP